jgi:hypothetical protein
MSMKPTIEINEANFESEVLKSTQPVLVEFATGWSLPSMMMDGALDEIGTPNLGLWYGIRCLPTILYFNGGEVAAISRVPKCAQNGRQLAKSVGKGQMLPRP